MGLSASSLPGTANRILLVDDDDCVREITGTILERMGHCVRATGNGIEALQWLEAEPFDSSSWT